jgi:hypothetical protein
MLDYRAWIVAGIILISAAGAYLVWYTRARAVYTARSLTAAPQPVAAPAGAAAKDATKTLHVDGCEKNFVVKTGELVEPRVVPGASLEQFRSIYGKETRRDKLGIWTWDRNPFTLTDVYYGPNSLGNSVGIDVKQGHVVETLDGVELGIDSFGALFRKLRDLKVDSHESIERGDGNWTLRVTMYSACGHKYRSEYVRTLPSTPELERQILPRANDPRGGAAPWRSDVFMNKVITDYQLVPSNGRYDSAVGNPSEHD